MSDTIIGDRRSASRFRSPFAHQPQPPATQPSGWSTNTYPKYLLQANATGTPAYDPWGHLVNGQFGLVTLGSTPVIQVTRAFDNRGRISTETDGSFYSFTALNGSSSGYDSVGNLKYSTDSVMGNWIYSYDTLNRLTAAQNTATTGVSTQFANAYGCWTYDGFGNRTKEAYSNTTSTPCVNGANDNLQLTVTTPTASNQVTGFTYDLAGNVLYDNQNYYRYDAEGRLCAVQYPNGSGGWLYSQYLYDASGTRIGKGTLSALPSTCNAPTTANGFALTLEYLLGLGGEQVTELSISGSTATIQHTNVFAGGQLQGTYNFTGNQGLHFALAGPLGTKRAQVSPTGAGTGTLELSCMSLPFGNSLGNTRVTNCVGPGTDATEHHHTGKERDTESGNDYFPARYFSSSAGRFLSPDWSDATDPVPYARLENPQTFNLYGYVENNPLAFRDTSGHSHQVCTETSTTSQSGSVVVVAEKEHCTTVQDWWELPGLSLSAIVSPGHHYVPQALWRNLDKASQQWKFLNRLTSRALKNPRLSNPYDRLHRGVNNQTREVIRDLEKDLGKSLKDFERGDFEELGSRLQRAGGDIEAFNARLANYEPEARSLAEAMTETLEELFPAVSETAAGTAEAVAPLVE